MSNPFTISNFPEQLETSSLVDESHHYDDPLPPKNLVFLQSINNQECKIKSSQVNGRFTNTVPMFLVLLVMMFYTLFNFIEGHIITKSTLEDSIKEIENYSTYYTGNDRVVLKDINKYNPFFGKEKISWWEYIKAYNSGKFFVGSEDDKYFVLAWLVLFPSGLYILSSLAFFVPMTYLVADRKRQILYSYVDGIVMATRYEDAQFGYAGKMLAFKLFYIHPETGKLGIHIYRPNVSHYTGFLLSSDTEDHRFITFLNAYMQQGRDAVSPIDYQARKPFLSFGKNPLPADFEQQVEQILAKLDQEKERHG
ncbi:TPA: hypothetical protein SMT55_000110 [Proteus mirabilis]|nr:hypothetical protein [Proteus mirabilis]HEK2722544.1 hypothetical protein [Proteus mirabilis]